jgi:hypothetical protein
MRTFGSAQRLVTGFQSWLHVLHDRCHTAWNTYGISSFAEHLLAGDSLSLNELSR